MVVVVWPVTGVSKLGPGLLLGCLQLGYSSHEAFYHFVIVLVVDLIWWPAEEELREVLMAQVHLDVVGTDSAGGDEKPLNFVEERYISKLLFMASFHCGSERKLC